MSNLSGKTGCVKQIIIAFCSNEHIQVVQKDIKIQLREAHSTFFTDVKEIIKLVRQHNLSIEHNIHYY